LRVHGDVVETHLAAASDDLLAEGERFTSEAKTPYDYLGVADDLTTRLIAEAREAL
jgi:hypothetical protein